MIRDDLIWFTRRKILISLPPSNSPRRRAKCSQISHRREWQKLLYDLSWFSQTLKNICLARHYNIFNGDFPFEFKYRWREEAVLKCKTNSKRYTQGQRKLNERLSLFIIPSVSFSCQSTESSERANSSLPLLPQWETCTLTHKREFLSTFDTVHSIRANTHHTHNLLLP